MNTCSGATKVVRYEKKEGGFNRVFILYLENGDRVVARVPFCIAGPRRLVTNSKVATMNYGMIESIRKYLELLANALSSKVVYEDTCPHSPRLERQRQQFYRHRVYHNGTRPWGSANNNKWPFMSPHQHTLCVKRRPSL